MSMLMYGEFPQQTEDYFFWVSFIVGLQKKGFTCQMKACKYFD